MRARSTDGGAGLRARDSHDGKSEVHKAPSHGPQTHGPSRIATQKAVNDFINKVAKVKSHRPDVQHEARGLSDNPINVVERDNEETTTADTKDAIKQDDFLSTMLGSRDEEDIQARSLFDLVDLGVSILGDFLRRDISHEDLRARDGVEDLVTSIISRTPSPERQMQARDDSSSFEDLINALSSRRASDELVARDELSDFIKILNSRELCFKFQT